VVNSLVQGWKKFVARVLDWHVREQVEFNRKIVTCIDSAIEALTETNRAISKIGGLVDGSEEIRKDWIDWRGEWQRKLQQTEIQFLRSAADLQGAFQHRVTVLDSGYRESLRLQHTAFTAEMDLKTAEIQQRMWADLERIRLDYERLIYSELRTIRQRAVLTGATSAPAPTPTTTEPPPLGFDYGRFAERFRGTEEYVKSTQSFYRPYFEGKQNVLDLGCGRGEFLELLRDLGAPGHGIDLSDESIAICRHKGLEAERADLFDYLENLPEASLDGIFCSQVVEHIAPDRLPEMIKLAASRLQRNGVIAIETPNPECLAIFATHFYLDPTHQRPVPHPLLAFYLEEFGVGNIEVRRLSPAVESMPSVASLPQDFRDAFFGGLDYAILGKKL
jgi:O-antigen chain-terminating methyltransferase